MFFASKIFFDSYGYEKTKANIEKSLESFDSTGEGYIDLMVINFPGAKGLRKNDPKNMELRHDSWKCLEEYVFKGHIKNIGVSNFRRNHLDALLNIASIKPVLNQMEVHPLYIDQDTIDACREHEILVQSYSPFGNNNKTVLEHPTLIQIANAHNIDVGRVILLWNLAKGFCVIPKSTNEGRLKSNIMLDGLNLK